MHPRLAPADAARNHAHPRRVIGLSSAPTGGIGYSDADISLPPARFLPLQWRPIASRGGSRRFTSSPTAFAKRVPSPSGSQWTRTFADLARSCVPGTKGRAQELVIRAARPRRVHTNRPTKRPRHVIGNPVQPVQDQPQQLANPRNPASVTVSPMIATNRPMPCPATSSSEIRQPGSELSSSMSATAASP